MPAGELLVRQGRAGVLRLGVAEQVAQHLRVADHGRQPVLREGLGCVVLRLDDQDGARVDVDEPSEDILDHGGLEQLRARHQRDLADAGLGRREHRTARHLDARGEEAAAVG